jgi:hypothetical protein
VQTFPANPLIGNGRQIENTPNPRRRVRTGDGSGTPTMLGIIPDAARGVEAAQLIQLYMA